MQVFDEGIYDIVEEALLGRGLTPKQTEALYAVPETSREAALIRWAGQELSMRASQGVAEVHAQIGLNSSPCPKDCGFCSFAVSSKGRTGKVELSRHDVVEYAKEYEDQGANLILLLTTASYSFEKLVGMAAAVREAISPSLPLLVNTDDMTLQQCLQLKEAGVNGAYHAVRMGEGVDTSIPVETRMNTLEALDKAGMSLSTCVEPIGPEHTPAQLAEATFRCIQANPVSGGAGKRVAVPGTRLAVKPAHTELANANFAAIYRLATGVSLRLNCSANTPLTAASGANLAWAEVGSNPRDNVAKTENGGRGSSIERVRKMFLNTGWQVLDGPSQGWMR